MKKKLKTIFIGVLVLVTLSIGSIVEAVDEQTTSSSTNDSTSTIEDQSTKNEIEDSSMIDDTIPSKSGTIASDSEVTQETTSTKEKEEKTSETKDITTSEEKPSFETSEFNQYVSLSIKNADIFKDNTLEEKIAQEYPIGQTFLAKEKLTFADGNEYFSLYDSKETLIGFGSIKSVSIAEDKGGVLQPLNAYGTITNANAKLISDFKTDTSTSTSNIVNQTFRIKGMRYHFDGTKYYQVYDNKNKLLGYITERDVKLSDEVYGIYQNLGKYVTISKNNYSIWQNFDWKKKYDSKKFINRTFIAKGEYRHFNGDTYYSLYDSSGVWYGYINKNGVTQTNQKQGPYFSFGKYVTVKNSNQKAWNSFDWDERQSLKSMAGKTYYARGIYHHVNGSDYYSLYDQNGKWQGYVNTNFAKIGSGREGAYQNFGKYVTVTSNNYPIWWNFSWKEKGMSKGLYSNTYQARGLYHHFNGSTYYSLYDNKGNWQGYINANGVSVADGRQGVYQSYWKNVTVYKKNYEIWSNFSWVKKNNTNNYLNRTFKARGIYHHFNGSTYVSLYDNNGKWYGYLNKEATSENGEKIQKVQALLNSKYSSSNYGIYVMTMTDGLAAGSNANTIFTAASTGKLPAMYYTQKQINRGKLNPNQPYVYTDAINQMSIYSYERGGAGVLQGRPFGSTYSLNTILNWTAKYSDNQGANFLGYYGANKYDWTMRNEISSIIGRQWISPFRVTAKENALMMQAIYKEGGQLVSYMQNTVYDHDRIPKYLPVKVAHKIGDLDNYRHDVGVVYADQPYVISILTKNTSYETIARLSREVYDIMK